MEPSVRPVLGWSERTRGPGDSWTTRVQKGGGVKGIMVVETRPSDPRREDEYNKWYDETHLPEVCAIPGIVSARRYRARPAGTASDGASSPTYVAIYDIEADDVDAV